MAAAQICKCSSTIDLRAPLTKKGLDIALQWLSALHTELTPSVEDLVRRARSEKDAARMGVVYAAGFGAASMLKVLTQEHIHLHRGKPFAEIGIGVRQCRHI